MGNRRSNQRQFITYKPIAELKLDPNNPRRHSERQIEQIAASITKFGFIGSILIDDDDNLIAGEARLRAAQKAGLLEISTVCVSHLSRKQRRAFIIADNRLAENATWDEMQLAAELQLLATDFEFDFDSIGFETAEIDLILEGASTTSSGPADVLPAIDEDRRAVSRLGDLWILGDHRLHCGDARDPGTYDTLLAGDKAMMVITDPPYNVRIDGHVSGAGSVKHREFAMASGEMTESEYRAFLLCALNNLAYASTDGSIHYIFMDWRHARILLDAAAPVYSQLKNICVWNKTNAGMGSFCPSSGVLDRLAA